MPGFRETNVVEWYKGRVRSQSMLRFKLIKVYYVHDFHSCFLLGEVGPGASTTVAPNNPSSFWSKFNLPT